MKIRNILLTIISSIFLCIVIGFLFFMLSLTSITSSDSDKNPEKIYKITVPSGETIRAVTRELEENKIIRNGFVMYVYARFNNFVLKAGTYHLKNSMSVQDILSILESGVQEYIRVSIPEGLTITKIAEIFEENKITTAQDFYDAAYDRELVSSYNIPAENFEGFLFPDTYFLTENMDAETVVKLMVDTFFEKISSNKDFVNKTNSELFDIVTLASIVQREYRVADEAPLIASVFENRLRRNIGLYSCATVEYIITEILGQPHPKVITTVGSDADTKIDNPYNTYLWAGLPPGPISNPGMIALSAAVNPPVTDYYYFRLVDEEEGRHVFTSDFNAHKEIGKELYTKPIGGK